MVGEWRGELGRAFAEMQAYGEIVRDEPPEELAQRVRATLQGGLLLAKALQDVGRWSGCSGSSSKTSDLAAGGATPGAGGGGGSTFNPRPASCRHPQIAENSSSLSGSA